MIIISINLYCANINVEKKIICALHKSYLQILLKKSTFKGKKKTKKTQYIPSTCPNPKISNPMTNYS